MRRLAPNGLYSIAQTGEHDRPEGHRLEASQWLRAWIHLVAKAGGGAPPAAVFDVDHTLVEPDAVQPALQRPIPSVCQLLSDCLDMGVQCIIVTARLDTPAGRLALGRVLRQVTAGREAAVYMRPPDVRSTVSQLSRFKSECRRDAEERLGVRVVATVGDNWHDLVHTVDEDSRGLWQLPEWRAHVGISQGETEALLKLPGSAA